MDDITLRTVEPDESTLIFTFLTIAARMAEPDEPIQKALTDSELIKYWKSWGRPGDFGIVAESEFPISCAWVRVIPREAAAYGFVAEGIPELGIGTIAAARGQGVGTLALERLLDECRSRYPGVCLSVRKTNPAIRLYERLGFKLVPDSDEINRVGTESIVMLVRF